MQLLHCNLENNNEYVSQEYQQVWVLSLMHALYELYIKTILPLPNNTCLE